MKTLFTSERRIGVSVAILMLLIVIVAEAQTKHVVVVTSYVFTPNELTISVGDTVEWQNTQGSHNVNGTQVTFPGNPESFGNSVGSGWTYSYIFNTAGTYSYQCDPHASFGMTGMITVSPAVETKHILTVNFTGMTPHVGETLRFWVIENSTDSTLYSTEVTVTQEFVIVAEGLEDGKSYRIDFYADHNLNGSYDAPPTDHAWRLTLDNVISDTTLNFTHNVNFTDIFAVTGVQKISESKFLMYPNPASTRVTLEFSAFNQTPLIRLIDIAGRQRAVRINENTGGRVELDISELPSGIYFIQIQGDGLNETRKLLKR